MKVPLIAFGSFLPWTLCAASFLGLTGLTEPYAISNNGVVAGYTYPGRAFRWELSAGYTDLGFVDSPGYGANHVTYVEGISGDGSVIVGTSTTYSTVGFLQRSQAFVWTVADGIQPLGDTSLHESSAYGISASGQVAAGWVMTDNSSQYSGL
jgi:uncharacterized membrane protein